MGSWEQNILNSWTVQQMHPLITSTNNFLRGGQENFTHTQLLNTVINHPPSSFPPNFFCRFSTCTSSQTGVVSALNPQQDQTDFVKESLPVDKDHQDGNLKSNSCVAQSTQQTESLNGVEQTKNGSTSVKSIKGQWTKEEDRKLIKLVELYGWKKWRIIAKNMVGRVGKQCRERWHNHLCPDIKKDLSWTEEEERLIIEGHERFGNKWSKIAKFIPGRSQNSIKNHWNSTKRRQTTKRKIKRPEKLKEKIQSTLLEEYIKNKFFNKGSTSTDNINSDTTTSGTNINATTNLDNNGSTDVDLDPSAIDDHDDDDGYLTMSYIKSTLDVEMDFIKNLFGNNKIIKNHDHEISVSTQTIQGQLATENVSSEPNYMRESGGHDGEIPVEEDQEDDYFSTDIYFSTYVFEDSSSGDMGSNMK